jgi:formamidopyrimidine-DNA glycosylase
MPEGHSLHRLARDQQELVGQPAQASSPQGRFTAGAAELDGRCLHGVEAYGKHLRQHYEAGRNLHVHLGMQGKWLRLRPGPARPQVRLRLSAAATVVWDLIAPTRCEILDDGEWAELVGRLGPDPLRSDADRDEVWRNLQRYKGPVGAALLDQAVVAGIGNVLRAETLFLAGIHPSRPAAGLAPSEFDRWWVVARRVMQRAVEDGRILTADLDDHARAGVAEHEARMVYRQDFCRSCGTAVEASVIGGRDAFACPSCQPAVPADRA